MVDQVRALLRQPEIVVGTWRVARAEAPDLKEGDVREPCTGSTRCGASCSRRSRRESSGFWWSEWWSGPQEPTSAFAWRVWPASPETSPRSRPEP